MKKEEETKKKQATTNNPAQGNPNPFSRDVPHISSGRMKPLTSNLTAACWSSATPSMSPNASRSRSIVSGLDLNGRGTGWTSVRVSDVAAAVISVWGWGGDGRDMRRGTPFPFVGFEGGLELEGAGRLFAFEELLFGGGLRDGRAKDARCWGCSWSSWSTSSSSSSGSGEGESEVEPGMRTEGCIRGVLDLRGRARTGLAPGGGAPAGALGLEAEILLGSSERCQCQEGTKEKEKQGMGRTFHRDRCR